MSAPQIKVALGSVEVTDTDRRTVAWYQAGRPQPATPRALADRDDMRDFLLNHGEAGLAEAVREYLDAGGKTASMERSAA